mgnify:CR=1 FL=1
MKSAQPRPCCRLNAVMNVRMPWATQNTPITKISTSTDWNGERSKREPDDDRQHAEDRRQDATPGVAVRTEGADHVEDAAHEEIRREEDRDGHDRRARVDDHQDAKDDAEDAEQEDEPPVVGHLLQISVRLIAGCVHRLHLAAPLLGDPTPERIVVRESK